MAESLALRPTKTPTTSSAPPRKYPLKDEFFTDAIQAAIRDSLFSPITLGEPHDVRLKKNFSTACWAYLPPHQIYLGTDLFEKPSVRVGLTVKQKKQYIANHYHHELGHALFTLRDMALINARLDAIKAPFGLFNLFEDARMEARYCEAAQYTFDWLSLEYLQLHARPESLLFGLIQAEGAVSVMEAALSEWAPDVPDEAAPDLPCKGEQVPEIGPPIGERRRMRARYPRVLDYYQRIVRAKGTLFLVPILKEWLEEFGQAPTPPSHEPSDLKLGHLLMTDPAFAAAFNAATTPVRSGLQVPVGSPAKTEADASHAAIAQSGTVLGADSTPVDLGRAVRLAAKFAKMFKATTRYAATETPQKRMSARNFCLGRPFYRRKEILSRGVQRIYMEVDCSGSMGGFHIEEGKLLVTALSILAKQGLVVGHVVLSVVTDRVPKWETFEFPMAQDAVDRISGYGDAEGLEYALSANLKLAQKADHVFVYTDGNICDKPVDKRKLHQQGVYTWGLYAGDEPSCLTELLKYFDKAVMRKSAEDLVDAILAQIK